MDEAWSSLGQIVIYFTVLCLAIAVLCFFVSAVVAGRDLVEQWKQWWRR